MSKVYLPYAFIYHLLCFCVSDSNSRLHADFHTSPWGWPLCNSNRMWNVATIKLNLFYLPLSFCTPAPFAGSPGQGMLSASTNWPSQKSWHEPHLSHPYPQLTIITSISLNFFCLSSLKPILLLKGQGQQAPGWSFISNPAPTLALNGIENDILKIYTWSCHCLYTVPTIWNDQS